MERVDLGRRYPSVRQRWRNGGMWESATVTVLVGRLDDGRWYTCWYRLIGAEKPAAVYDGPHAEHYARGTARRWRRTFGGEWTEG